MVAGYISQFVKILEKISSNNIGKNQYQNNFAENQNV
jgi:hypothetical protein